MQALEGLLVTFGFAIVFVLTLIVKSIRIVNEYERGVVFRLGRVDPLGLPGGQERVPALAPGEGQQPHRADHGARHSADLLRHQEPD